MTFREPGTGRTEEATWPAMQAALIGPLYFAIHRIWLHALLSVVLLVPTVGLSWVVYVAAAGNITRRAYLSRGWEVLSTDRRQEGPMPGALLAGVAIGLFVLVLLVVIARGR